jgi:hypothetical protein
VKRKEPGGTGVARTHEPARQHDAKRAIHTRKTTRIVVFDIRKDASMTTEISTNTAPARGLVLQTMADAMSYAKMVANSEFAPKDFRGKPESCLLAIDLGSSIGLSRIQSLQSIAVINGRPTIWGDAALALVQSSPVCEFISEAVDGDGEQMVATCIAKRRGYPAPSAVKFTVADAKKAGLWGKAGPWTQYPKRMLQLRARGFALRDAFPDVLKGLVTAEEAQDYPQASGHDSGHVHDSRTANITAVTAVTQQAEAAKEPAKATMADMERSRLSVQKAKTPAELERMQSIVEQRLRAAFYTPDQADELLNLINGKLDWLSSEPEDRGQEFPHEAAQHEVQA